MNISRAIYTILSAHAGLTSLVSTKIYPVTAPQQTEYPYLVFGLDSVEPINRQTGVAMAEYINLDVNVVSKKVDENESIAKEVRLALDRVTEGIYSGTKVGVTLFDDWNGPALNDDDDSYVSTLSFRMLIHR